MTQVVCNTKIKCGLIQAKNVIEDGSLEEIKEAMLAKHEKMIIEAGEKGVQILCLQEIFYGPYFCSVQDPKYYNLAERIPDGPTIQRLSKYAKKYNMVLILPIYEEDLKGVYYNTAVVIDADGKYIGRYRKNHIPQADSEKSTEYGFWEKFYFKPGNLGYPTFETKHGVTIGVYICYDRHFPEGARALALNGAEIVFNPSATTGRSKKLWKIEQPAHAIANGYFIGAINRVGLEGPWNMGEFYGTSYFVNPKGDFEATASDNQDELLIADLDIDMVREARNTWAFFRDRRPETYISLSTM
jgi:N-carbamoylputrescine amidase